MVRVKICGVRTVAEALQAAEAGADAIGLNFWRRSPRYVEPAAAERIVAALPPFVAAVGVFVGAPAEWIRQVAERCRLAALQLHGEVPAGTLGRPVIRPLQVRGRESLEAIPRLAGDWLLLDGHAEGLPGGTGRRFDWRLALEARALAGGRPIILAGGLTPETVAEAVALARPDAVDVASGVESAPGVKDPDKVARFVRAAKGGA
ncbi:MAG TPA: phosphoribosylanthranilate isomerase [Thermodesulfobacteriota bacterium]|nr:phosphoribosylanthranilate isomerase [Thermodesulfobacteriota bacterium]